MRLCVYPVRSYLGEMMFYIAFVVSLLSDAVIVYSVQYMPKRSFWQVITFDSALLIALITCIICCYIAFKGLRPARVNS